MIPRQPLPRIWLVTDERQGEALLPAVRSLPAGAGILFRHYSLLSDERRRLFDAVRIEAKEAKCVLLAGTPDLALSWGADGWHGRGAGPGLHSCPVHDRRELRQAEADGAALLFVSPVFATRSHPGGRVLGTRGFERLARMARRPVVALGGVTPSRARTLLRLGAYGWAGIDAWSA